MIYRIICGTACLLVILQGSLVNACIPVHTPATTGATNVTATTEPEPANTTVPIPLTTPIIDDDDCVLHVPNEDKVKIFGRAVTQLRCARDNECVFQFPAIETIPANVGCVDSTVRIQFDKGASCLLFETDAGNQNANVIVGNNQDVTLRCIKGEESATSEFSGVLPLINAPFVRGSSDSGGGRIYMRHVTSVACDTDDSQDVITPNCSS